MDNYKTSAPSSSNGRLELNNEQLQHLLNKISSDEQKEISEILKTCTTEMTLTRGLPFTAAVLGSLYFARTRLPSQYRFGPKGWPFYAIIGIGSLTVSNVFSLGTCRDRVQPKIRELWEKYKLGSSKINYEELRRQNRQTLHPNATPIPTSRVYDSAPAPIPEVAQVKGPAMLRNEQDTMYDPYAADFSTNPYSLDLSGSDKDTGYSSYNDTGSYMSGTPSGARRDQNQPTFS